MLSNGFTKKAAIVIIFSTAIGCSGKEADKGVAVTDTTDTAAVVAASQEISFPLSAMSGLGVEISSPRIPSAMSWAGTRELVDGMHADALRAVESDTSATAADSLLRLFKIGTIQIALGNADSALAAFSMLRGRPLYAPLAHEKTGDIHASRNEHDKAMAAYNSALASAGLPLKYRQHIFAKIRALAAAGKIPLPAGRAWLNDYRRWERTLRRYDVDGLSAAYDSLVNAALIVRADSLLEKHLPELPRSDACRIVDRVFAKRPPDERSTAKSLVYFASQASACRDHVTAGKLLDEARTRPDFAKTVPASRALLVSADIAYRASRWQEAADQYARYFRSYGANSDVLMNAARAHRNLNATNEAKKWYDLHITHFPAHRRSQEILWLRAWDLEADGKYKEAAEAYAGIFSAKGIRVEEARMRHALCHYKLGQYDSVVTHLNTFQSVLPQSTFRMSAMFWQGKAHAARGNKREAHRVWNALIQRDPTDYHAHRAGQLMEVEHQITTPASAQMTDAQAREWLETASPRSKKKLTAQDTVNLRRGAALLAVAQPAIAEHFFDDYVRNYGSNLLLQFEIAVGYALAGGPAQSFGVAQRLSWRVPIAHRPSRPLQVLAVMYPPLYAPYITLYSQRFETDPLFVSALMRQESIFNGRLVSVAGAIGLMQIMPATGKNIIAKELNEPFAVDSLYNHRYNIRFGIYYLNKRLVQFDGDKVLALASYNGGAHNVVKWQANRKTPDDDIFAEDIGFRETRIYVKKVMGNYWTYQVLANMPGYTYNPRDQE